MQATPRRLIASTSRLLQRISPSSSSSSSSTSPASSSSSGGSERTRPLDPSKLLHAISRTQTGKQKRRDRARAVFSAEQDGQNKNNEASQSDLSTGLFAREDPAIYLESIRRGSKSTSTSTDTGASGVTGVDGDLDSPPSSSSSYFNLGEYHSMLDIHPGLYSTSEDGLTKTVHINAPQAPMFPELSSSQMQAIKANSEAGNAAEGDSLAALAADATNAFTVPQLRNLHRYPLVVRRVVNMTSKGKQPSMYALVVVGDGNGLVGFGEGKSENIIKANDRAFVQAVKNMDYVQRKDSRTTWADLMSGKWGATTVELRSRPPGFGLRTSPLIHQIAKAAGILDLSAKVRGSRNGMNTVKATINLLHGGAAPLGLGDLSGKEKLARRFKGVGMRTATEVGLDLGRKAVELR